jgi:hypothetical protein
MPTSQTIASNSRSATARLILAISLSCLLLSAVFTATNVEAQSKRKKPASGSGSMPGSGHAMPGSGAPPMPGMRGNSPYGGAGTYGQGPNIKKRGAAERKTRSAEPVDPEKLPDEYHVPPEPTEALTTTDEWIENPFPDPKKQRSVIENSYKPILGSGAFASNDQKKFVADIVRWRLSLLTRKEFREQAYTRRKDILADIGLSPTNKNGGSREVRRFILQTIADEAPRLFKYHAVARINGAILLAELSEPGYNESDGDGNRKPAEPCTRGMAPLLALVNDKSQLTAARIWGVIGLVRLAALPELKASQKNDIMVALLNQLSDSENEHEWYQWRLVEGLGRLNIVFNQDKSKPVVADALARVLADEDRPPLVRAEAALSLGRLQYTTDINAGLIAYEMALLAQQMADDYGKAPDEAMWKLCFMKVYGGFKPLDDEQKRGLLTQAERGPLAGYKRTVQEAFDVVLPVVKIVIHKQEGMETARANLRKWLDSNTPKSYKIHPDMEPIIQEEPIVKKKPPDNGGVDANVTPVANGGRG